MKATLSIVTFTDTDARLLAGKERPYTTWEAFVEALREHAGSEETEAIEITARVIKRER